MKIILAFLSAVLFVCFSACSGSSNDDPDINGLKKSSATIDSIVQEANKPKSWEYEDEEDKMTSKKIYMASIDANELLNLRSPYDGYVIASLTIRKKAGITDSYLTVTKGQFLANVVDEQPIKIRFDSTKAETYYCSAASDGDSRFLFINSPGRLIARLKKAKHMIIEAEMYDNGYQLMEFNTQGFKWEH